MTTSAQIDSLKRIDETGSRKFWKKRAYAIFQENPLKDFTDWEIVVELGLDKKGYHLVQPRISDLREEDKIKPAHRQRIGRDGVEIDSFIYNPNPNPQPKIKVDVKAPSFQEFIKRCYERKQGSNAWTLFTFKRELEKWGEEFYNNLPERKPCDVVN